ncbi:MAG: class I SAM-dependent methyltransferase [Bacteroidetes bacterium]|nr:class I SAM-dependent methyltransferase [Bacteroidota bacterium]
MKYRSTLYANYHSTQSGRASGTDAAALFQREKRQFAREVLPLLKGTPSNAVIFDMGCGSGSLLKALQEAGFTGATGMDISPEQVQMARSMGVEQVTEGDALQYVKDQTTAFDVLLGMDIIEHFTKDELVELLQDIRNSLKPGGVAIFRTPNLDGVFSTVFANGDFTHENYLNASSAQQVCLACGFNRVQVWPGVMHIENPVKELLRKCLWAALRFRFKLWLFATARSTKNVYFEPNMIIVASV